MAEHANEEMGLSVILPAYNEVESVGPLYEATVRAVEPLGTPFEIIFVDDGSSDGTFARCAALAAADPRVRVIKLRRNYGQTAAMVAGIDQARGAILITMDADLQNDPADIPLLVGRIEAGYDLVVGWRHQRQDRFLSRKFPSVVANWLIARVTGVDIKDNGCSLKAYRADLIKNVPLYSEMHRFIPAMASMAGARIDQIKVRHHARRFGTSKYGLSRIYKVFFDMIAIKTLLVFVRKPGTFFMGAGCFAGLLALLSLALAMIDASDMAQDPTVVMMGVSALLGSLALFLIFGGMVSYLFYQTIVRRRELSVVIGSRWRGLASHEA
ncbi:MAG TPA: glycosyltransferase family 2 protein [Geminicoccaceae bacterium]|nr:glycosyltransferase family 2 protein [Geminicoccaceae bacterium]